MMEMSKPELDRLNATIAASNNQEQNKSKPSDHTQYETRIAHLLERVTHFHDGRHNLTAFQLDALGKDITNQARQTYQPATITHWSCFIDDVTNSFGIPEQDLIRLRVRR
jgi:hypothetical protein